MTSKSVLRPELAAQLERLGPVEVVVGIPSYNNARTIGHVVRAVSAGLAKYFPDRSCLIVNSDGGSSDGTPQAVLNAETGEHRTLLLEHPAGAVHRVTTGYLGVPGKGSAFRTIFSVAAQARARACAVVDSDLRSISPEWIELLLEPILNQGVDFVAPLYSRHKYDGTITNSIVYPLTRALYGQRVRQPIGGDFGFSGSLAAHYLGEEVWETDVARYGIDIWMSTRATADGYKVAQSYLGAKLHDAKDPGADLSTMFTQVVGTVFDLMGRYRPVWEGVKGSADVPTFGFRYAVGVEPVAVNVPRMIELFRRGAEDLADVWRSMLSEPTVAELAEMAQRDEAAFDFSPELWVRTVYDAAVSYRQGALPRQHLLKALIPLYLGRTAAFVRRTSESSSEEVEREIENLCSLYETMKPYLLERWDHRR